MSFNPVNESLYMQVYHFVNEKHGMDDLQRQRLKIATLDKLNDPFELFGIDLSNREFRRPFKKLRDEFSRNYGLLCFSRNWRNPVQWSHYADKHQGLCFEFDVPDKLLHPVSYSETRKHLVKETEEFLTSQKPTVEVVRKFLFTKYAHWRYESEVRWLIPLKGKDRENGEYFENFSENLKLVSIFIGAESKLKEANIRNQIGSLYPNIKVIETRLAFKTFRVVHQRKQN